MDLNDLKKMDSASFEPGVGGFFHAYIVTGLSYKDICTFSDKLAAAIVCAAPGEKPCGVCPQCRKALHGIHPDILETRREEGKREISIGQIREIVSTAAVLPNDAERKVYIIRQADAMSAGAQNAMLKLLEEPPARASFILEAENPGLLLQTVRSRCVKIQAASGGESGAEMPDGKAAEFLDCLAQKDKLALVAFLFSCEKMDRLEAETFFAEAKKGCVCKLAEPGGEKAAETYLKAARLLDEARRRLDYNVGVGHLMGMLMAEL